MIEDRETHEELVIALKVDQRENTQDNPNHSQRERSSPEGIPTDNPFHPRPFQLKVFPTDDGDE